VEKSLNEPLSGEEIKDVICQRIRQSLDKNSTLADDVAYPGFGVDFGITITFTRSPTSGTQAWGRFGEGEPGKDADQIHGNYQTDHPDLARQDHDMEIPVMAQGPAGPVKKKVKIEKAKK
jgi:hypothetical protein